MQFYLPDESPLWRTLPPKQSAPDWLHELSVSNELSKASRDACVDLIWNATHKSFERKTSADEALLATQILASHFKASHDEVARTTLREALELDWSDVKICAMSALSDDDKSRAKTIEIALGDQAWMTRREAIETLAQTSSKAKAGDFLIGADDPHWRVRLAVVHCAERSNQLNGEEILKLFRQTWHSGSQCLSQNQTARLQGVWRQLKLLSQSNQLIDDLEIATTVSLLSKTDVQHTGVLADPDPRVVAWELRKRKRDDDFLLDLACVEWLGSASDDLGDEARRRLELCSTPQVLELLAEWTHDKRDFGYRRLLKLIDHLDDDRFEILVNAAAKSESRNVQNWARAQRLRTSTCWAEVASLLETQTMPSELAVCLKMYCGLPADIPSELRNSWLNSDSPPLKRAALKFVSPGEAVIKQLSQDEDPGVRAIIAHQLATNLAGTSVNERELLLSLQQDAHPWVRANAMNEAFAKEVWASPSLETSWNVLNSAGTLLHQAPTGYRHADFSREERSRDTPTQQNTIHSVMLGESISPRVVIPGCKPVSPLGLSGHYHMPDSGYEIAVDAGVGLMFFEPNYAAMRRFFIGAHPKTREEIQLVAGTFHADPKGIRSDIDRVLRLLKRERIDFFVMFWVRSWNRISDEARQCLERAQEAGKIGRFSLSTHDLELAHKAILDGWAPVMVRHNAAHRRAEETVLPTANTTKTPLIMFNNTCYGRLLGKKDFDDANISAADCYRFSLMQPGAAACWTAPATISQLNENLETLTNRKLSEKKLKALLNRGKYIRELDAAARGNLRAIP